MADNQDLINALAGRIDDERAQDPAWRQTLTQRMAPNWGQYLPPMVREFLTEAPVALNALASRPGMAIARDNVLAGKINRHAQRVTAHDFYTEGRPNYDPGIEGPENIRFGTRFIRGDVNTLTPNPLRTIEPPPAATPSEAIALRKRIDELHDQTPAFLQRQQQNPQDASASSEVSRHLGEIDRLRNFYNQQYGSLGAPVVSPYDAALQRQLMMGEFAGPAANDR